MIRNHFTLADVTMRSPRREWNDLATITRMTVDQMSFNTYQPNNGDPLEGDILNSWRSRAIRPIVRNKVISVAAHTMAHLIFPKIFSYDQNGHDHEDAAQVMTDLMEWAADQSEYEKTTLFAVIGALVNPAAIVYTEYAEAYRKVKRGKENNAYKEELILDEVLSGFKDSVVPVDELYIENFYEHDIQKQSWLIWRRVQSYGLMQAKYAQKYANFKYVTPGVQLIYNDANSTFYNIYDPNLRQELCEEIIYWNRNLDLKIILVNGVMLTEHDNPNPRNDKLYPFSKFGYELVDEGKCFYYKSAAFKIQQDANIVNTLYPMIIDGTYLNVMPPMVAVGGEVIGSDVIIPGMVTTLTDKESDLRPVKLSENLAAGMNTLLAVEQSVNETIQEPNLSGGAHQTAYALSLKDKEYSTMLGLFIKMLSDFVRQYGKLRLGDILQYMTIADASKIEGDNDLVYRTFLLHGKENSGRSKSRKIQFDATMPDGSLNPMQRLEQSYKTLQMEKTSAGNVSLARVNPELFRNLAYILTVSPDVMNPRSEDTERAFMLEEYDRAIQNPLADQEAIFKDFLLGAYPKSRKNVDKYVKKQEEQPQTMQAPQPGQLQQNASPNPGTPGQGIPGFGGIPQSKSSPLAAMAALSPAPTTVKK